MSLVVLLSKRQYHGIVEAEGRPGQYLEGRSGQYSAEAARSRGDI